MLHAIHLEDHRAFAVAPFAFLSEPARAYGREEQTRRGNRLRASEMLRIFSAVPGLSASVVYAWQRTDRPLPTRVAPEIKFTDDSDLRTSHLAIYATKLASGTAQADTGHGQEPGSANTAAEAAAIAVCSS